MTATGPQPPPGGPVGKLLEDLGSVSDPSLERQWPELAKALRKYVETPDRSPVESYDAIRELLQEHWKIAVIETEEPVSELEQLGGAGGSIGRCGVRLLDLVGRADIHVVVRRDPLGGERQMLWTLLHELGHFASHFEFLQSVSTVYQRICLNPGLERELARFSREQGAALRRSVEVEADLFALDWLLPRWRFGAGSGAAPPTGLTLDGYRYLSLRRALGSPSPQPSGAATANLNRAGEEERGRQEGRSRPGATRWDRAAWLLWNRERLGSPLSAQLAAEYNRIVGGGGRYVPELRRPVIGRSELDSELVWLPRVAAEDAAAAVDEAQWMPLLVAPEGPLYPEYNIPIRPLPLRETRDSRVRWSHMFKPPTQRPLPLETWIGRAREQEAGLLLFPRSPAERTLDARGIPRP
jgi:hypothetical protein